MYILKIFITNVSNYSSKKIIIQLYCTSRLVIDPSTVDSHAFRFGCAMTDKVQYYIVMYLKRLKRGSLSNLCTLPSLSNLKPLPTLQLLCNLLLLTVPRRYPYRHLYFMYVLRVFLTSLCMTDDMSVLYEYECALLQRWVYVLCYVSCLSFFLYIQQMISQIWLEQGLP